MCVGDDKNFSSSFSQITRDDMTRRDQRKQLIWREKSAQERESRDVSE